MDTAWENNICIVWVFPRKSIFLSAEYLENLFEAYFSKYHFDESIILDSNHPITDCLDL